MSLRNAALACAGSALLASLVTGLVVGSGSKEAAPRPAESKSQVATVATVATVAPSPPPPVAPPPTAEPEPAKVEKVAAPEAEVEKPKPKPVKVSSYKPAKVAASEEPGAGEADKLAPNPERDDPVRAVPATAPSATDPTWQADPGF